MKIILCRADPVVADCSHDERTLLWRRPGAMRQCLIGESHRDHADLCRPFDAAGAITDFGYGFADAVDLDPAESATFEVRFTSPESCEAFLVSASGVKQS